MNTSVQQKYKLLFKKFNDVIEYNKTAIYKDMEEGHYIEDEICRTFIEDICNNTITGPDIKKMANKINKKILVHNIDKWYS